MRTALLLAFTFLLTIQYTKAQDSGFLPGYIINNVNDTLPGLVKHINQVPYRVLIDIKFKKDENAKVETYSPNQLKGFKAGEKHFESHLNPRLENIKDFMEVVEYGHIKLFNLTFSGLGPSNNHNYSFLLKAGETALLNPFDPFVGTFKQIMSNYVGDNKLLAQKINAGDYKKKDLPLIVKEYNTWKSQQ